MPLSQYVNKAVANIMARNYNIKPVNVPRMKTTKKIKKKTGKKKR